MVVWVRVPAVPPFLADEARYALFVMLTVVVGIGRSLSAIQVRNKRAADRVLRT